MSYTLGPTSLSRLQGVHPALVAVVKRAIEITAHDFTVVEGLRTAERQAELYAQGRTAPGAVVTWVKVSNHEAKPDGYGHAVDLAPWANNQIAWTWEIGFKGIYDAMMAAAESLGVTLRSGADWNQNGILHEHGEQDFPHYEIITGFSHDA